MTAKRKPALPRARKPDRGPSINLDQLDLAVMLRIDGKFWAEIARLVGVNVSTILRWRLLPEWEQARAAILAQMPEGILTKARQVYLKRLDRDLQDERPSIEVAEKVMDWFDPRVIRPAPVLPFSPRARGADGEELPPTGGINAGAVIFLPIASQGKESLSPEDQLRKMVEVQLPQAKPAPPEVKQEVNETEFPAPPAPRRPGRRQIVVQEVIKRALEGPGKP